MSQWNQDQRDLSGLRGQSQIPAFLRRQKKEPQRSSEEAKNVQWVLFGEQRLLMALLDRKQPP